MAMGRNILALVVSTHLCAGAMVNVALKKPATMSSIYVLDGNDWAASKGVDGDINAIILTDAHQEFAWWMVDLQTQVHDATVRIYHQTSFNTRRNGEQLYTSTTPFSSFPGGQLCLNITGRADGTDIPDVVSVNCSGTWRYLMVYTQTDNNGEGATLDFGEVEVLVCSNGTYDENCTKSCSSQCAMTSTSCDRYTGACLGGCKAGWKGTNCKRACPNGTYGRNCSSVCVICAGDSICDHVTGNCLEDSESIPEKNASSGSDGCSSGTAGVIGGFVGVIVTLAVIGGVCVCLIRQERLQWNVSKSKESHRSVEMADGRVQENQSNTLSGSAQSETAEVHDYSHLDGGNTLDDTHYDVIQKNYENI